MHDDTGRSQTDRYSRSPGEIRAGDIVQLTDVKGRPHTVTIVPGKTFHTHRGGLAHDEIIAAGEGSVVTSTNGAPYIVLRSRLEDYTLGMPRGATVVYPKDSARIVAACGLSNGSHVLEAGAGSGALTCALLTAVGPHGRVVSFEKRADFAEVARGNVERWFDGDPTAWTLVVGDLADPGPEWAPDSHTQAQRFYFDAAVLDMLAPWECLSAVAHAVRPGGVLVAYVATTTQLSRLAETIRLDGRWIEPRAEESMVRTWHLEGLAVRPDHRMIGHTGFLLITRRLADGAVLPPKRTRPAKGAYGEDYTPPSDATSPPDTAT